MFDSSLCWNSLCTFEPFSLFHGRKQAAKRISKRCLLNYKQKKLQIGVISMQDNGILFAHRMQLESLVSVCTGDSDSAHTIQVNCLIQQTHLIPLEHKRKKMLLHLKKTHSSAIFSQ